jgi:DNA-binding NarL/FixJ family response regulator
MGATSDHLSIVEACYAPAADDRAWVSGLLDSAEVPLNFGPGCGLSLFQEQPAGVKQIISQGRGDIEKALPLAKALLERLRGSPYRRLFYPRKPVLFASSIVANFNPVLRATWQAGVRVAGAEDVLGMMGYPAPGWIFTMFLAIGRRAGIGPQLRCALQRIRVHIESGLRLRLLGADQAVAVLSPDGKVLHLAKSETEVQREQLGHQVKVIDRGRAASQRRVRGLEVWTALVDGRWSLVERTDTDGQRHYLAFENTPHGQAYRALSPRESLVVDQSIQGLQGKHVAYSTGLTPARISLLLASAATKLGFRSRLDLVRVASTLRSHGQLGLLGTPITEAEREVWRLAYGGMSNAEIAERRGTTVRTVVNQVASLFRKLGVAGRAGLVAAGGRHEWICPSSQCDVPGGGRHALDCARSEGLV